MTKEQCIEQYYRTGLWCFKTGRRADARLMMTAIRCFDPIHPMAARLHALLGDRNKNEPYAYRRKFQKIRGAQA